MNEPSELTLSMQGRYRGCLVGGAVGDALGAPVEFLSLPEIIRQFGPAGIRDFAPAYDASRRYIRNHAGLADLEEMARFPPVRGQPGRP